MADLAYSSRRELTKVLDPTFKVSIEEYGKFLTGSPFGISNAIIHILLTDRRDVFLKYINIIADAVSKDINGIFKHRFVYNPWMFYRIASKGYVDYGFTIKVTIFHNMQERYLTQKLSMDEIYNIQDCFHYIKYMDDSITIKMTEKAQRFLDIMEKMRERRFRIAKKKIYYYIIKNVVCNPDHPIGRKLIMKEYNALME